MYYLALARKDYGEYEKAAEVYTEVLKAGEGSGNIFSERQRISGTGRSGTGKK